MAMLLPSFFSLSSSSNPPLSLSLPLPPQAFSFEEVKNIWAWLLLGFALFLSFAIPCGAVAQSFRRRRPCSASGCSEKPLNPPTELRQKLGADSSRGSHSHSHVISPTLAPGKRVVLNQTLLRLCQTLLVGPDQPEAPSDSRRILTVTTIPDSHPCRIMLRLNQSPPAPGIAESLHALDSRPSIVRSDVSPFLTQLRNRRSRPASFGFVIDESELIDPQTDWCLSRLACKSQQVVHRRRSAKFPADTAAQHKMIGSVSSFSSSSSSMAVMLPCSTNLSSSCSDQKGSKQADCAAGLIEVRSSDTIQAADSIVDSEKQVMKEATKIEEMVYALPSSSSTVTTLGLADLMDSYSGRKDSKWTDCAVDLTDLIPLGNSDTLQVTDLTVDSGQQIMKEATQTEEAADALHSSSSSLVKMSGVMDPKISFDAQNDPKRTGYVVDLVDPMMKISSSEAESTQIGNADTVQAADSIKASEQWIAKETIWAEETVDVLPSSSSGEILSLTESSSSHNNHWESLKQIDCAYSVSLCTVDLADLTKINAASCNCETDLTAIQIANTIIREVTDSEAWMAKEVGQAGRIIGASPSSSLLSMKMQNLTDSWSSSNCQGIFKQISYTADVANLMTTSSFCKHEADLTQVGNADLMHEATDLGQWIAKGVNQTKEMADSLSSSLPSMKVLNLVDSQSYCNNRGESKQIDHVCSQDNLSGLIKQSFSRQTRNEFIGPIETSLPQIDSVVGAIGAETEVIRSNSSSIDAISLPEIVETACISTAESANPSCLLCSESEEKSGTVTAVSSSWFEVGIEQAGKSLSSSTIIETADEGESKMCLGNGDEGILSDLQTWWDKDAILIEPETSDLKEWNDAPPRLIGDWFLF